MPDEALLNETLLVAVLGACVLYPPSLRDLFMRLATELVYQPRWTEQIHIEWMHRRSLRNPPKNVEDYVATMRKNGLKELATHLEAHFNVL
jgi:hypothetical protein